jgi:hypothetical protein
VAHAQRAAAVAAGAGQLHHEGGKLAGLLFRVLVLQEVASLGE